MPQFVIARTPIISLPEQVITPAGKKMKTLTKGGSLKSGVVRFMYNDTNSLRVVSGGSTQDLPAKPRGRRPAVPSAPRAPRSPAGRGRRPRAPAPAPAGLMWGQ